MRQSRAEYAEFMLRWIEKQAWTLQEDLAGHPQFAAQVEELDTIIHASVRARAALAAEKAPCQAEGMAAKEAR